MSSVVRLRQQPHRHLVPAFDLEVGECHQVAPAQMLQLQGFSLVYAGKWRHLAEGGSSSEAPPSDSPLALALTTHQGLGLVSKGQQAVHLPRPGWTPQHLHLCLLLVKEGCGGSV